jgi:hypothetical protein
MAAILPPAKPRLSREELESRLAHLQIDRSAHPLIFVGIRGYYARTMGSTPENERMIYDDAIFILSPSACVAYNGNVDPNGFRKGRGTGAEKGMAVLNPGWWPVYKFDLHRRKYLALCQRGGRVSVTRDGSPPYVDTGDFGINIHMGSRGGTSSLGCQTLHPDQWGSFIATAQAEAKRLHGGRWKSRTYGYALLA